MGVVKVEELEKIFDRIIGKLRFDEVEEIELESDLYRFIPTDEWNKFEDNMVETGSLEDDLESLKLLLSDPSRPCTYVDFDRIASILRAISQQQNPI